MAVRGRAMWQSAHGDTNDTRLIADCSLGNVSAVYDAELPLSVAADRFDRF
mgnify:CR=1 FL=1